MTKMEKYTIKDEICKLETVIGTRFVIHSKESYKKDL